ncbi:MAG: response regulator [Acidobacteriota bacterium]|nr:response regulator [Acidobacteriota bacterium]
MGEKPVILVVDDDGPILALMRNLLKEFGFQPVTAATGSEAIDVARRERPALVLLDKNMPGMRGDQIIRTLREEPGFYKLPILILSGERLSRDDLAALGADGAVQKPFDVMLLIDRIRQYVGGDGHL